MMRERTTDISQGQILAFSQSDQLVTAAGFSTPTRVNPQLADLPG
jgi:hypothetical protein